MKSYVSTLILLVVALLAVACGEEASKAAESSTLRNPQAETAECPSTSNSTTPFDDAQVFIEFNATDEDLGFHATFDASGWKEAMICSPDGSKLFEVKAGGSTEMYGLSELFFEGAEPPLEDQPLSEFLSRFPEGEYLIVGMTTEGDALMRYSLLLGRRKKEVRQEGA